MSALEIRDFLSGEFEPVPLADVMAVLRARETARDDQARAAARAAGAGEEEMPHGAAGSRASSGMS